MFDLVIQQYDNPVYRCAVMGLSQPGLILMDYTDFYV